jgi:hypothetical protein
MKNFVMLAMAFFTVPLTHAEEALTRVGDKLSMQCGAHKIVLTCGHSDEIAKRQKYYSSPCNYNEVEFIPKKGTSKKFGTYTKGAFKGSTPIGLFCRVPSAGKKFQVAVVIEAPEYSTTAFIAGFAEDGTKLIDEEGNDLTPPGYAKFIEMPGQAAYWDEYHKNKPASRYIEIIKEKK